MSARELIERWPGKSANEVGIEHPALYHMLDVASVAEVLLKSFDIPSAQKDAFAFLTALHDIGKLNSSFRNMLRQRTGQNYRHWEISEVYLQANKDALSEMLKPQRSRQLFDLIAASAGHHGRPPSLSDDELRQAKISISQSDLSDAQIAIGEMANLWPSASLKNLRTRDIKTLSWWLSGLITTSDWIGSNTDWYCAKEPSKSLAEYLQYAREIAPDAVQKSGLNPKKVSTHSIFDWPALRPMQKACKRINLPDGPTLALIEDETGAGKTEAALMLAQRMLIAGKGEGLFCALPTMATADAMFSRITASIGKMFFQKPTVTLAHGRTKLSQEYADIIQGRANAPEDIGCTEWLADNRRRALLANVGVGTIDQALLSVLPVKFQTLRHFGLSSKVLIVDEVHELGEPYIAQILVNLLKMHRAAGGSAILLTATLPIELRASLLETYDAHDDRDPAYPALTIAGGEAVRNFSQVSSGKGTVHVERLDSSEAAVGIIEQYHKIGAACVWVRNSVDDAIVAVDMLKAAGIDADLLHARYAMADRKRIEKKVLKRFGRVGADRSGRVLVGTQLLEASLDLDFDVMISDLAPMAGLIQRAGRLWRHMDLRPADERPVEQPVLYVISPDPKTVKGSDWLSSVLDQGAFVYSADVMWRTALTIFDGTGITAPSGIRGLIEAAHADQPDLPVDLEHFETRRLGKSASHASLASQNVVNLEAGYRMGGNAHDDASYPTRLGPPQLTLVLARETIDGIAPFHQDWVMSEVSAAQSRLDKLSLPVQSEPPLSAIIQSWPDWMKNSHILCPVANDGFICEGLHYFDERGLVFS